MKKATFPLFMLVILLIGCGQSPGEDDNNKKEESTLSGTGGLPKAIQLLASNKVAETWEKYEVKSLKVVKFQRLSPTAANKAKGISEKWCIDMTFTSRRSQSFGWEEKEIVILVKGTEPDYKTIAPKARAPGVFWGKLYNACLAETHGFE